MFILLLCLFVTSCTAAQVRTQKETLALARITLSEATEVLKEVCNDPGVGSDIEQYCDVVRKSMGALREAINTYEGMLTGIESGTTTQAQVAGAVVGVASRAAILWMKINEARQAIRDQDV